MKKDHKIIVGNWKMNPVKKADALDIIERTKLALSRYKHIQVVVCPPFVYLPIIAEKLSRSRSANTIALGVQNFFHESKGSFTGEISADLVTQFGITYAIIGHSERRKLGETDADINKKIQIALKLKLTPIVCVGETARDEDGQYLDVIKQQLTGALVSIERAALSKIIFAYEPVWAIGATAAMNPHEIHEMKIYIKKVLIELYRVKTIIPTVLYGGAVDPTNAEGILKNGEADGLLIGRQSLDPEAFKQILAIANNL